MAYLGIVLFLLVGPVLALLGLVRPSLFHRGGWKPGRLKLLGIGVGVSVGGLVLFGVNSDQLQPKEPSSASSTTAKDAPTLPTKAAEVATSPVQAAPPAATVDPGAEPSAAVKVNDTSPPPAKPAPVTVSKPAIEVPAGAVAKYCATEAKKVAIIRESDRLFPPLPASAGLNAVQEQERKSEEWRAAQYAPLNNELEAALGLDRNKVLYLATEHQWNLKCRAIEAGRPFLDTAETLAATASDATSAKNALEGYYVFRLNSERYPLFDRNQYSAIRCSEELIGRSRFVGCQPISLSKRGLLGVYVVGRAGNGAVQIAPVNGTAMTHIADMPHLKVGETEMPIAAYVGPAVDIPSVIKALE